jgi:hypothetical protein
VALDDPAGILTATPSNSRQEPRSPSRPTSGPPSAPKALPKPTEKPMDTQLPTTEMDKDAAFLNGDDDRQPAAVPATRPGATRGGQATAANPREDFLDPDKIMARATSQFAEIEDGDADGWFRVWKEFVHYEKRLLPIDWVDLTELAQRHYDRTHDDGGKVLDSGEVDKE